MAIRHEDQKERMSIDEFFMFIESDPDHRYELVDGYPYKMTKGTPDHSIIGSNVGGILGSQLRKRPYIVYSSGVYIKLADEVTLLCPDVSVSCDRRDFHATKVIQYPCVVVEVLSPGTKTRDLGMKAEKYQDIPTVQEILFIDTQVMRIRLYRRATGYWIMLFFTQGDTVELTSLSLQFLVIEAYEKTTFDDTFREGA